MDNLITNEQTMTSVEIAEITGKPHNDLMKAIRSMEGAWVEAGQGNFSQTSYTDSQGRLQPCYSLTKTECLYIAAKFSDVIRVKLIVHWKEMEKENVLGDSNIPTTPSGILQFIINQAKQIDVQQKLIANQDAMVFNQKDVISSQDEIISMQKRYIDNQTELIDQQAKVISKYNLS